MKNEKKKTDVGWRTAVQEHTYLHVRTDLWDGIINFVFSPVSNEKEKKKRKGVGLCTKCVCTRTYRYTYMWFPKINLITIFYTMIYGFAFFIEFI